MNSMLPKINIKYDLLLFTPILIMGLLGIMTVYSATGSIDVAKSHFNRFIFGFIMMLIITQIRPDFIQSFVSKYAYIINVLLLFAVIAFGTTAMGATRWLNLGFITFQPSELVKVTLPLYLSYLIYVKEKPKSPKEIIICGLIIMIPALLVVVQPDLGTSVIIMLSGIVVLFQAGLSIPFIFIVIAMLSTMFPLFWSLLMDYQKQRVLTMFNPEFDSLGSGYHIIQSKIAIGNGGVFGTGFLSGTQTQLNFIPEQHTDFIFSAFAEEYGFMGFLIIMFLYAFIILRVFSIIKQLSNNYQKLVCGSFLFIFSSYIFINLGMISGILPVVGVPLPFFSYGGTYMIIQMISFGIVASFYVHNYKGSKNKYK